MAENFTRQYLEEEFENDFDVMYFLTRNEWTIDFLREVLEGKDEYKKKIEDYIKIVHEEFKNDACQDVILFGSTSENLFANLLNYIGHLKLIDREIEDCLDVLVKRYVYLRIPKNLEKIQKNFQIPRNFINFGY